MQETAQGIRIVKAFNLEPIMRARMHGAIEAVRQRSNKMNGISARTGPLMETLGGLAVAGVMLWAGYCGDLLRTSSRARSCRSSPRSCSPTSRPSGSPARASRSSRAWSACGLMFKILDTKPTMDGQPGRAGSRVVPAGEIVFERGHLRLSAAKPVVPRLRSPTLPPARLTALVGPSGAGKTTIINLIERFYDVAAGRIAIDGQDIAKVRLASLRDQIALVSQDIVLFRASIRDNIRFGRPDATDAEVEEAARNAMAHDFILATKDGYDTILDDGGASLSGGQRQRIAIARAMLRECAHHPPRRGHLLARQRNSSIRCRSPSSG